MANTRQRLFSKSTTRHTRCVVKIFVEYHKHEQRVIFEICFAFISLQKIPSKDHEAIHTDILKEKYRSKEDILKELYRPKEDLIKDNCGFCEK